MDDRRVRQRLEWFAANVSRCRGELSWTQLELAEHAAVEPRTIQAVESSRTKPNFATIVRLADALGVEIGTLFSPTRVANPRRSGRPRKSPR